MKASFRLRHVALACGIAAATSLMAQGASAQQRNCIDALAGMPEYSRAVNAITLSHMVDTVHNMQNVTLFVPTNSAIEALNDVVVNRFFPRDESGAREADPTLAAAAVQAHIVQGRFPAAALAQGVRVTTEAGSSLSFSGPQGSEQRLTINGGPGVTAHVVQADVPCANGIVHGIDRPLLR